MHRRASFVVACVLALVGAAVAVPVRPAPSGSSVRARAFEDGAGAKAPAASTQELGFDYVHLVQEWPGSFCDTKKGCLWPKDEPTTGFLLHGLWPEYYNGSWPQYCDDSAPFNMTALEDLVDDLHTYWPSLVSPDQASFWAHEWTRHGTCMEPFFSSSSAPEHDYFALVLRLRESFDGFKILAAHGISPGSTTSWEKVKMALEGVFPKKVEVGCNFAKSGKRQLLELRTCYAPSATIPGLLAPIDCPNEGSATQCGSPTAPVDIPPFHPSAHH